MPWSRAAGSLSILPSFQGLFGSGAGFGVLAFRWIGFNATTILKAWQCDFVTHRLWMRRSVSLTCAAVTLRLCMAPMMAMRVPPLQTYDFMA
jgi:Predicted membrane protein (DUF2306)